MNQSKNKKVLLFIFALFLLAGAIYFIWLRASSQPELVYCTQEAKLCSDGSYVSRVGPNCEFTSCPSEDLCESGDCLEKNDSWKIISDSKTGISFQYPETLLTEYIHAVDWPPQVQVVDSNFTCIETGQEIALGGQTIEKMVGNRIYCVTKASEGAAGSIYTNYTYVFLKNNKTITFTFSLRSVQCGNYDDPQKTACEKERETFDPDSLVDRMVQTIK